MLFVVQHNDWKYALEDAETSVDVNPFYYKGWSRLFTCLNQLEKFEQLKNQILKAKNHFQDENDLKNWEKKTQEKQEANPSSDASVAAKIAAAADFFAAAKAYAEAKAAEAGEDAVVETEEEAAARKEKILAALKRRSASQSQ